MIIATWNIRGFNKAIKHSEVSHFLRENKVDMLGLLETRVKENRAQKILKRNFRTYKAFCNYNKHHNGRIWILWNPATTKVDILEEHSQVVHCKVLHHATGRNFYCSIVYGSNNADTRKRLWNSMECFASYADKWAAMGDFNVIRQPAEKLSNTPPVLSDLLDFNSCLSSCALDDLSSSGCDFTWYNKQDATTRVYSKLDRILVNNTWLQHFSQTTGNFLSPGISDHSPAVLTFHDADTPKKQFRFLNCWVEHPDFHSIVDKCWVAHKKRNSMFRLMQKLKNVKQGLKQLHASHFADIENKVKEKREALSNCFHDLQNSPDSPVLLEREKQLSTEFWHLKDIELKILAQKAKAHNIKYNDTCSKFFFAKIKERQQSQMIGEIKGVDGTSH
ncbi:uncharacterized protein LOC141629131 [Silene latifolia]|uniref:uncharacterized protein LOC141629131 n=1 Tax=Silene latifolia TaxID=37657 RepID=UPI003D78489A